MNFGRACETLRAKSFAMQSEYRSMESDARAMSVSAIGGFVRKMRAAVSPGAGLELHTALAERALDSTRGDAHFRRVRFAEVLDTERLCLGHAALFRKPRCRACRRACRTRCASAPTRASRRCASASRRWRSGARTCGARLGFWRWRA